jgi:hypothetical protein
MPAPLVGAAAAAAARLAAKKLIKKRLADNPPKSITKIVKNPNVTKPVKKINLKAREAEARAKLLANTKQKAQPLANPKSGVRVKYNKQAMEKSILKERMPKTSPMAERARAIESTMKRPIKINTDPTKPKGVFGPLKKKLAAADTPANRAKAANNARALKAANKKK